MFASCDTVYAWDYKYPMSIANECKSMYKNVDCIFLRSVYPWFYKYTMGIANERQF